MTENRLTELWNKAVAEIGDCTYPKIITRFAELVAADEREACAKVCEARMERQEHEYREDIEARECAAAIRMRSNA